MVLYKYSLRLNEISMVIVNILSDVLVVKNTLWIVDFCLINFQDAGIVQKSLDIEM